MSIRQSTSPSPSLALLRQFAESLSPRVRYLLIQAAFQVLRVLYFPFNGLLRRLRQSPGLPVPNPSSPYWTDPHAPISRRNADPGVPLPEYADIVIIGSGITGTSFARALLDEKTGRDDEKPMRVVMLEARDACSGATGRNGGHITPMLYHDYIALKRHHGKEMAKKIIRFRLAHLENLLNVAEEEDLMGDSQCRKVEALDVFTDKSLYRQAKKWLHEYKTDLPEESAHYKIYEKPEEIANFRLAPNTVGCLSTIGGAVHPYRLVTGILTRLLNAYQSNFDLYTHTPCTGIKAPGSDDHLYKVETPRGTIRALHIVHATNGWVSHLLPRMVGKIIPARGTMTAQTARDATAEDEVGKRSFVRYPSKTAAVFDYLTQQLPSPSSEKSTSSYPAPDGEMMLGGGFMHAFVSDFANADDSCWSPKVERYLRKTLGEMFTLREEVRLRSIWSGILGMSTDERPWVGRVPHEISGRDSPTGGGEWIAAGYTGEGMVHAWLSGKALARMVKGEEVGSWFPEVFSVSVGRWRGTSFENFVWENL